MPNNALRRAGQLFLSLVLLCAGLLSCRSTIDWLIIEPRCDGPAPDPACNPTVFVSHDAAVVAAGRDGPKRRLEPLDIQLGMRTAREGVAKWRGLSAEQAIVQLSLTIAPDGTVSAVTPLDRHSATPVGACVAAAAREARFTAFDGPAMSITYPVIVR